MWLRNRENAGESGLESFYGYAGSICGHIYYLVVLADSFFSTFTATPSR